jgi:hypothetical protein
MEKGINTNQDTHKARATPTDRPGLYLTTGSLHRMWQFDRSLVTLKAHWERARAQTCLSAHTEATPRNGPGTSGASISHSSGVSARRRMSAAR